MVRQDVVGDLLWNIKVDNIEYIREFVDEHRARDFNATTRQEAIRLAARKRHNSILKSLLVFFKDDIAIEDLGAINVRQILNTYNNLEGASMIMEAYDDVIQNGIRGRRQKGPTRKGKQTTTRTHRTSRRKHNKMTEEDEYDLLLACEHDREDVVDTILGQYRPEDIDDSIRQEAIRLAASHGNDHIVGQLLKYFEHVLDMKDLRVIRPLRISRHNPNAAEDIVVFYIGHVGDLRKLRVKRKGNNAETLFIKNHANVFNNSEENDNENNSPTVRTSKRTQTKKTKNRSNESHNNHPPRFNPYNLAQYYPTKNGPNRVQEPPVYRNENIKHLVIVNKTAKKHKSPMPLNQKKNNKVNKTSKKIVIHNDKKATKKKGSTNNATKQLERAIYSIRANNIWSNPVMYP
jgi:hypothetical protein